MNVFLDKIPRIGESDIFNKAHAMGLSGAKVAIQIGYYDYNNPIYWPELSSDNEAIDAEFETDTLVDKRTDILTRAAIDISNSVQFPVSTAFIHGLGVIATAMTRAFKYDQFGTEKHVNLYVITSQPTGAGKSGVNEYFTKPVINEFERINNENKKERSRCAAKIKSYECELKSAQNEEQIMQLEGDISHSLEVMSSYPIYTYTWTDITPEALEQQAFMQGGLFNLVSDEATIINTLLGNMYSDRVINNEMLLKGWDGELVSSARVGRKGVYGFPNGNVAVIAQDETIRAILSAGEKGNGICQRFLIYREKNLMGKRKYGDCFFIKKDEKVFDEYQKLIKNICGELNVKLIFDSESLRFLSSIKTKFEDTLSDSGENSQELLRGVVAKVDKQIMKMSCVLHAIKHWKDGGSKSRIITCDSVSWAYSIYDVLLKSYINSASSQGYLGKNVEVDKIKDKLIKYKQNKINKISILKLRNDIKNTNPFKGHPKLIKRLRSVVLPEIESQGWLIVDGNDIYINPKVGM